MKKIIIMASLLFGISAAATAQHRAVGLRIGATGLDASYQYEMSRNTFFQGDMGLDFGSSSDAGAGFKAVGTYNIVWARPAWTDMGTWVIYAGPGAALGYVGDRVTYKDELAKITTRERLRQSSMTVARSVEILHPVMPRNPTATSETSSMRARYGQRSLRSSASIIKTISDRCIPLIAKR